MSAQATPLSKARAALAERGDQSGKHLPDDERALRAKQNVSRLFDVRRAENEAERAATERKRDATLEATLTRAATRAVRAECERIEAERKAALEERFGPQASQHDMTAALSRLAEAQERQNMLLEKLTSGGKK